MYPSTQGLTIGAQIDPTSGWNYYSRAIVDELSIYNRALSAAEVQAIYLIGSGGKCPVAPVIQLPPQSQTVQLAGSTAFSVVATGMAPLAYQWYFGANPNPGATSSALQAIACITSLTALLFIGSSRWLSEALTGAEPHCVATA